MRDKFKGYNTLLMRDTWLASNGDRGLY